MAHKGKGAGQGANSEQDHAAELINSENKANIAATQAGGARYRRKGDRIERELVSLHKALGIHSERYPLSGASRFRGSGHDIDIYLFGRDAAPLVAEVKARKSGGGFVQLERWLGVRRPFPSPQQRRSTRRFAVASMAADRQGWP